MLTKSLNGALPGLHHFMMCGPFYSLKWWIRVLRESRLSKNSFISLQPVFKLGQIFQCLESDLCLNLQMKGLVSSQGHRPTGQAVCHRQPANGNGRTIHAGREGQIKVKIYIWVGRVHIFCSAGLLSLYFTKCWKFNCYPLGVHKLLGWGSFSNVV